MDYLDEFMAANPRHAAVMHVKTGVKRDGAMVAHHVRGIFDSGAYGAYKPGVNLMGFSHAGGPYRTPNVKVEGIQVYTNNVPLRAHARAGRATGSLRHGVAARPLWRESLGSTRWTCDG